MELHSNGARIFYQDIIIPTGLNIDDVLHMAAHILEEDLERGVNSNEELRQNIQRGLESMEEELSLLPHIGSELFGVEELGGSDIDWLNQNMNHRSIPYPNPEDGFWDTVGIRLTEKEFEKVVNTFVMGKTSREKYRIEKSICSICQEDINSRQHCSILNCKHIFHKKCIKEWLVNTCEQPTCPCCRENVRNFK